MNENKFLKNITPPSSPLPAVTSQPGEPTRPTPPQRSAPTPTAYDPVTRLIDELSRHTRAIEGFSTRLDRLEGRPAAATQAELRALLDAARQGIDFTIDSNHLAQLVLPALTNGMPSPGDIQAAADAGANAITVAGTTAAEQIERASARAASRIEGASQSKADALVDVIGFTSWKAFVTVLAGFVLLIGLVMVVNRVQATALAESRSETQAVREFTNWVKNQPAGKRLYDQYHDR